MAAGGWGRPSGALWGMIRAFLFQAWGLSGGGRGESLKSRTMEGEWCSVEAFFGG